jgi:hypothetical protein
MLGVGLALAVFVVAFLAHLIYSHTVDFEDKEPVLVRFMIGASTVYVVGYPIAARLLAPLTGPPVVGWTVDFVAGVCAIGFLALGYVEFWSLIERSFTLRILVDAAQAARGLTRAEIANRYSEGRGLDWMMEKRINDLVGARMLVKDDGQFRLTRRARLIAWLFARIQQVFRVG